MLMQESHYNWPIQFPVHMIVYQWGLKWIAWHTFLQSSPIPNATVAIRASFLANCCIMTSEQCCIQELLSAEELLRQNPFSSSPTYTTTAREHGWTPPCSENSFSNVYRLMYAWSLPRQQELLTWINLPSEPIASWKHHPLRPLLPPTPPLSSPTKSQSLHDG